MYEKAVSPSMIAKEFGVSAEFVRTACRRGVNPCPHVRSGNRFKVRASEFDAWYRQEELRTVGAF